MGVWWDVQATKRYAASSRNGNFTKSTWLHKNTHRSIGDLWRGPIDLLELLLVLGRWVHLTPPWSTSIRYDSKPSGCETNHFRFTNNPLLPFLGTQHLRYALANFSCRGQFFSKGQAHPTWGWCIIPQPYPAEIRYWKWLPSRKCHIEMEHYPWN